MSVSCYHSIMHEVQIKLIDDSLPLPAFQTQGSAGMDLYVREGATIQPNQVVRLPLNVIIVPPAGFWVLMAARGSLHKKGLQLANSVGIFDADFCGPEDEYQVVLHNFSAAPVVVERLTFDEIRAGCCRR